MCSRAAAARSSSSSWPGCCPGPGLRRCTLMLLGHVSSFPELSHGKERGPSLRPGPHIGLTPHPFFSLSCLGLGTLYSASPTTQLFKLIIPFKDRSKTRFLQESFLNCPFLSLLPCAPQLVFSLFQPGLCACIFPSYRGATVSVGYREECSDYLSHLLTLSFLPQTMRLYAMGG